MTLSYEVSKKLKEFLGEDMVPAISQLVYCENGSLGMLGPYPFDGEDEQKTIPAYSLEDLLSVNFCKSFSKHGKELIGGQKYSSSDYGRHIYFYYWKGGYPEVEKCLLEMMK